MKRTCLPILTAMMAGTMLAVTTPTQAIVYEQWDFHTGGPFHGLSSSCGLGLDGSGNVYLAGSLWKQWSPSFRFYAMKFAPAGDTLWTSYYSNTPTGGCVAEDVVVDPQGNVYATGWGGMSNESYNYVTVKFNTSGQLRWAATYNGPGNSIDKAKAIALDQAGNVYVTGASTGTDYDYATIKYSPQGAQMWVARYNSPSPSHDHPVDIAVDQEGNVYVTGGSSSAAWPNEYDNIVTVKYNAEGQQQWVANYDGAAHLYDTPETLKIDNQNNVYIVGTTWINIPYYDTDFLSVKYNSSGILQWATCYNHHENVTEKATDLVIDADGSVIVTGCSSGAGNVTIRYSAAGILQWVRQQSHFTGYYYHRAGLAMDANHDVYVTGSDIRSWDNVVCATYKYTAEGDLQWIAEYDIDLCAEGGSAITTDPQGNVIVTGDFHWWEYEDDHPFLVKYNQPTGDFTTAMIPTVTPVQIPAQGGSFSYNLQTYNTVQNNLATDFWWKVVYPDSSFATPVVGPIQMILPLGNASYLRAQRVPGNIPAGTYQYILNAGDYPGLIWSTDTIPVIKLPTGEGPLVAGDWSLAADEGEQATGNREQIEGCSFSANPNPFNPSTAISYELRAASFVKLTVWDLSGRPVATLLEGMKEAGIHEADFDGSKLASGLYFVRMEAGDYMAVKKMMLVK